MLTVLPDLHQGHAPITLQNAFHDALERFEEWQPDRNEPAVAVEGPCVPISSVFQKMLDCTDLLPLRTAATLKAIASLDDSVAAATHTYSQGARLMLPLFAERLAASGRKAG